MPETNITSVLSVIALVSAIVSGLLYILSIFMTVKRLRSHNKKSSPGGVACVIIATVFAVIAFMLYSGFSLWFFIGIVIVDSVFVTLLTE